MHLRDPVPQLSAPLDFISETRIINSETFSAPTHQTKHIIHAAGDSCQRFPIYRLVNVGNRTRDASVECRIYDVELNGRFETADKNIQFGAHWLASLSASVLIHFALVS